MLLFFFFLYVVGFCFVVFVVFSKWSNPHGKNKKTKANSKHPQTKDRAAAKLWMQFVLTLLLQNIQQRKQGWRTLAFIWKRGLFPAPTSVILEPTQAAALF